MAYSSTNGQTDGTPYLTAIGTPVRDGIIAANFLPIGTVMSGYLIGKRRKNLAFNI